MTTEPLTMLVILALVTFRLSHALVHERGLFGVLELFRRTIGVKMVDVARIAGTTAYTVPECQGSNELAKMFCCTACASFWISGILVLMWNLQTGLLPSLFDGFATWFATAALSLFAERIYRHEY